MRKTRSQSAARRQLEFLRRQALLIAIVTAAAVGVAGYFAFTGHKVYQASTKIVVGQGGGVFSPQFGNVVQPFTQTMSSLLESDIVMKTAIRNLGLQETPRGLLSNLNVASNPDSAVLQVSYKASTPEAAVRTLREVASAFTSLVREKLGTPGHNGQNGLPLVSATVFDPAHASSTPVSPRPTRTLVFAGFIGLVLGIMLALLREALDDRIYAKEDVEEYFGAPLVAEVPKSMLERPALERTGQPVPSFVRAVDPLRVELSRGDGDERVIIVTSRGNNDGKSAIAANLGVSLTLAGADVICVDGDPTTGRLAHYLHPPHTNGSAPAKQNGTANLVPGLEDVHLATEFRKNLSAEDPDSSADLTVQRSKHGRLQLLGSAAACNGDYLGPTPYRSVADLVAELKSRARYIVIDAPPLESGMASELLSVSDRAIIVTREKVTREQATSVRETLERLHVSSSAIVTVD
jgi:capsular polysaccharide biosynthesis protein/Mrp family chromosome partitioning ATPase